MRRRTAFLGVTAAVLAVVVFATGVSAHQDHYSWESCTWETTQGTGNVTVGLDPSFPFPADNYNDGVKNSFFDRIRDSVTRWHNHTKLDASQAYGFSYTPSASSPLIRIAYETTPTAPDGSRPAGTATKVVQSGLYMYCVLHGAGRANLGYGTRIRIDRLGDWFTQDDTQRKFWEDCPESGYLPTYTCSKVHDFGSVVMHELGHTVGMKHAQDVDAHTGTQYAVSSLYGSCGYIADRATMCSGIHAYETGDRVLHAWDQGVLRRVYLNN